MPESRAIVYLGPSMPLEDARQIIEGDYRAPIRRGDLTGVAPGTVVAMIDGIFEQNLSVSPSEVQNAVARGVVIFGGASMGALRAAEVPGVIGVGQVFKWYRDGVITRDDEVALLFAESPCRALTVPAVSVRFAVGRLCRLGTIDQELGNSLISVALQIPYKERTYQAILEAAGVLGRRDSGDLIRMLEAHDIKYRDAQAVLEAVDRHGRTRTQLHEHFGASGLATASARSENDAAAPVHNQNEVLIWESGDRVKLAKLYGFLGYTGKLEKHARAIAGRFASNADALPAASVGEAQAVFNSAARRWGWVSAEEARVTLADLGLDLAGLSGHCLEESQLSKRARALIRENSEAFRRSLWAEIFLRDLALKRETMRFGSILYFAERAQENVTPEELREAGSILCKVNEASDFTTLRNQWTEMGFSDEAAETVFMKQLARARRAGRELVNEIDGQRRAISTPAARIFPGFALQSCPKPPGELRFSLPLAIAEEHAQQIGKVIGVTRIGMIGELADLGGIQVAQAARPGNAWSSSYGSGKSRTREGAVVGSIMEETEKWAQEKFLPHENLMSGTFAELCGQGRFIDPASLDLPYDSIYQPDMPLHWHPCFDLLGTQEVYLPVDVLQMRQRKHDIYFTQRGVRKHMATNGLGSGFSREEAVLHGLCEYVERHAQRLAEILLTNPGGLGSHQYRFVDLSTSSAAVRDLAERLSHQGATVRVLDITSEIAIPTFVAGVTRELQRADGYGTHPDPNTAIEMALLEAAQTIASAVAGGREDLSIKARSLGRHERPRTISPSDAWFWLNPDPDYKPLSKISGLSSGDIHDDVNWCLDRIQAGGVKHVLAVDLTHPGIEPATVVRVIIPGLETNNPFYTGSRARLLLLRDLLPTWRAN